MNTRRELFKQLEARRDVVMQNLYVLDERDDQKSEAAKVRLRKELRELGDQMNELLEKKSK